MFSGVKFGFAGITAFVFTTYALRAWRRRQRRANFKGLVYVLCGFSGAGKSTAARVLHSRSQQLGLRATQHSFAARLKDMVASLFRWPRHMLEGETVESRGWRTTPQLHWARALGKPGFTPLQALREIGTEAMRQNFANNIWVATLLQDVSATLSRNGVAIITDARFPNEFAALKETFGSQMRVLHIQNAAATPPWISALATLPRDKVQHVLTDDEAYTTWYHGAPVEVQDAVGHVRPHLSEWSWIQPVAQLWRGPEMNKDARIPVYCIQNHQGRKAEFEKQVARFIEDEVNMLLMEA